MDISTASIRVILERKRRERESQDFSMRSENRSWKGEISMEKYAEWLKRDSSERGVKKSLLAQTILEEGDDSDYDF
jgi:hypothetical protein